MDKSNKNEKSVMKKEKKRKYGKWRNLYI